MYKLAGFFRYVAGMSKVDAQRYWSEVHGPMVMRIPGLQGHVQNDFCELLRPTDFDSSSDPPFDGFVTQWYESRSALESAMTTREWSAVMEDGPNFIDLDTARMGPIEERTVRSGEHTAFKVVGVAHFRSGVDRGIASSYWNGHLGDSLADASGASCCVQSVAIPDDDWNLDRDGILECWYPDRAACVAAIRSTPWQTFESHSAAFIDFARYSLVAVKERVIQRADT